MSGFLNAHDGSTFNLADMLLKIFSLWTLSTICKWRCLLSCCQAADQVAVWSARVSWSPSQYAASSMSDPSAITFIVHADVSSQAMQMLYGRHIQALPSLQQLPAVLLQSGPGQRIPVRAEIWAKCAFELGADAWRSAYLMPAEFRGQLQNLTDFLLDSKPDVTGNEGQTMAESLLYLKKLLKMFDQMLTANERLHPFINDNSTGRQSVSASTTIARVIQHRLQAYSLVTLHRSVHVSLSPFDACLTVFWNACGDMLSVRMQAGREHVLAHHLLHVLLCWLLGCDLLVGFVSLAAVQALAQASRNFTNELHQMSPAVQCKT